eukprot:scaffold9989_cov141-Skeletonema_marinoi.AAC.1
MNDERCDEPPQKRGEFRKILDYSCGVAVTIISHSSRANKIQDLSQACDYYYAIVCDADYLHI